MHNISNMFPKLKDFGLWLTIWPVERDEFLCFENLSFVSPFLVQYFYNFLANAIIRNRKKTGAMLYPFLTPTLNYMDVPIFPIISLTTMFLYILFIAEKKGGGHPYLDRMVIRIL